MVKGVETLEDLKEDIGQKVTSVNLLFLDLSSTCTGYAIATVDFETKKASMKKTGAIWFNPDWDNQEKYQYIYSIITNYFNIVDKIDYCVCEAYMINTKKLMGSHIGPEMHGVVQVALAEIGIKYKTILPQSWRHLLGIKRDADKDYKQPTKDYVEKFLKLPPTITSNITRGQRAVPFDVTDALAIGMAFLTKLGFNSIDFSNTKIQDDVSI